MDYKTNIAYNSKRAMATAALFTEIFQKYLDRHKCEKMTATEELDQFSSEILDHCIIVGGFPRDILLNRSINDIDIIINLRELCKLQTNHCKKYHNKKRDQGRDLRCVYWQRYLERFSESDTNINEQQKNQKEMIAMHNLNYIFNSSFFLSILKQDELLDNKLSVKDISHNGFISCQIVNTVKYGNINLDQQCIDFVDTFSLDKCYNKQQSILDDFNTFHRKSRQLSMSGINIDLGRETQNIIPPTTPGNDNDNDNDDEQLPNKSRPEHDHNHDDNDNDNKTDHKDTHGRLKSMAVIEFDIDDLGDDFGDFGFNKQDGDTAGGGDGDDDDDDAKGSRPEYITIEVPIYSGKVRYKLLNYDFSINTCILPLSNIIKLKEYNNDYNSSGGGVASNHTDPMTWIEIIENGLGECDGIQDNQINKILKTPEVNHDHCTIEAHPITFIFWRIIQWMIRDSTFKIDQNLIIAQIKDYDNWLNTQWFDIQNNCDKFMNGLIKIIEKECISIHDIKQMLNIMDMLQFNKTFIQLLNDLQNVRHSLVDAISACKNDNLKNSAIVKIFQEYQYPIEEAVFKKPSKVDEQLEKATLRKQFLEDEIVRKNERIEDLEKQNDRLLKEVQYLQQLNTKNDRVKDLEAQNGRLLQELQFINDSKLKLAINANQTIDQLRNYLIEYQQVVKEKVNNNDE